MGVFAAIGGVAYAIYRTMRPDLAFEGGPAVAQPISRDAEPERPPHIKTPQNWDMVDEQGDESFPASDPPGNY